MSVHHEVINLCAAQRQTARFFPVNPLQYFSDYSPFPPGSQFSFR